MKRVLIAIERESFNYLFKFNECQISINRVIDQDFDSIQNTQIRYLSRKIEHALPYFDSEEEVILIEYIKDSIFYGNGLRIVFSGVLGIIPLTQFAYDSLTSKLNKDFRIYKPLSNELYQDIKKFREDTKRINAAYRLLGLYQLKVDNNFLNNLRGLVIKIVGNEDFSGNEFKALYNLIKFDLTPSFVPSGNVESFLKLGCITLLSLGASVEALKNGPFYKIIIENKNLLNKSSLFVAYLELENLFDKASGENKERINKVKETFNSEFTGFNAFLAYYIYLSFNRLVKDKEFDLLLITNEIDELKQKCPAELAYALAIFGYVHSFDRLYESIHRLSNSPLFKTSKSNFPDSKASDKETNELSKRESLPPSLSTKEIQKDTFGLAKIVKENKEESSKDEEKFNISRHSSNFPDNKESNSPVSSEQGKVETPLKSSPKLPRKEELDEAIGKIDDREQVKINSSDTADDSLDTDKSSSLSEDNNNLEASDFKGEVGKTENQNSTYTVLNEDITKSEELKSALTVSKEGSTNESNHDRNNLEDSGSVPDEKENKLSDGTKATELRVDETESKEANSSDLLTGSENVYSSPPNLSDKELDLEGNSERKSFGENEIISKGEKSQNFEKPKNVNDDQTGVRESESEYVVKSTPNEATKTYKELDYQTILIAISKLKFKNNNKALKDKLLKELNSIIQIESTKGLDSFSFNDIKVYLLTIAKQNSSLQDISEKIIMRLEKEFI